MIYIDFGWYKYLYEELTPFASLNVETHGLDLVNKLFGFKYKTQYLLQVSILMHFLLSLLEASRSFLGIIRRIKLQLTI